MTTIQVGQMYVVRGTDITVRVCTVDSMNVTYDIVHQLYSARGIKLTSEAEQDFIPLTGQEPCIGQ